MEKIRNLEEITNMVKAVSKKSGKNLNLVSDFGSGSRIHLFDGDVEMCTFRSVRKAASFFEILHSVIATMEGGEKFEPDTEAEAETD